MNASGGYVRSVQIEKTTFRQVTGGSGVGSTASNVVADTTNFNGALSATDTTVQAALDTLDDKVGINALTEKTTPVDADMLGLMDSAASNVLKKLSWANVKAALIATVMTWTGKQTFDGGAVIKGATSAVAAGYVGETFKSVTTQQYEVTTTAAAISNGPTITLTPGVHRISYEILCGMFSARAAGSSVNLLVYIATSADTNVVGDTESYALISNVTATVQLIDYRVLQSSDVITVASTTTYRLCAKKTDTVGTDSFIVAGLSGLKTKLTAVRIA
jgi:hypothetical protein